ncbi:hypothetical protein ACRRVB_00580 [Candidatus Cardinium hertigii]|uniref:hypothetical protein n=1 Tax=Candidatus Cardinium hertigii TaxID=247481 RepID=UPI003D7C85B3
MKKRCTIEEEMFLPSQKLAQEELKLYEKYSIPSLIQAESFTIKTLLQRNIERWIEPFNRLPQNIFTFQQDGICFFGRKLIAERKLTGHLKELNCSHITPSMLLGILVHFEHSAHAIAAFYHPLTFSEKLNLFSKIAANPMVDIYHPFVWLDPSSHRERSSPKSGWSIDTMRAKNLEEGERPIRSYTLEWLKHETMDGKIIYDPACSTGLFLHTIKSSYPYATVIGQDLSQKMVDYASPFVDKVIWGDAAKPGIPENYCDYLFVRFLNAEVVSRKHAYALFPILLSRLKKNGKMIVFGHTPVLLYMPYIECFHNLIAIQRTGYAVESGSIFQYYILRPLQ